MVPVCITTLISESVLLNVRFHWLYWVASTSPRGSEFWGVVIIFNIYNIYMILVFDHNSWPAHSSRINGIPGYFPYSRLDMCKVSLWPVQRVWAWKRNNQTHLRIYHISKAIIYLDKLLIISHIFRDEK